MSEQGKTTVVNVRTAEYDVYIGRANRRYGLAASPYANPFRIGRSSSRDDVIYQYREWAHESEDPEAVYIRAHVHELRGKRLGCWCFPSACHGTVLVEMADNFIAGETEG